MLFDTNPLFENFWACLSEKIITSDRPNSGRRGPRRGQLSSVCEEATKKV